MITTYSLQQQLQKLSTKHVFFKTPTKTIVGTACSAVNIPTCHSLASVNEQMMKALHATDDDQAVIVGAIPFDITKQPALQLASHPQIEANEAYEDERAAKAMFDATRVTSYPSRTKFEAMVDASVKQIKQGSMTKVVLARTLEIEAPSVPHRELLHYLATHNDKGYTYSIPLANNETLLGASPELLIKREGNRITANPIAGSRKRTYVEAVDAASAAELMQSAKDLHEHRIVVEMVKQALGPHVKNLHVPASPSILYTDSMIHLSTVVTAEVGEEALSSLELANLLHPTPAVCGQPREAAFSAIQKIEPFDRGYFAGIVGYMDAAGNGEWVVTIRCGKIHAKGLTLYAGAGIVETSVPAEEACETGAKFQTMLNAMPEEVTTKGEF